MILIRPSSIRTCLVISLVVAVSCLAGCQGVTPIKSVLDDPSQYMDKPVVVSGRVTSSAGLLSYGAYMVDDGTGSIAVVSGNTGAPREGAQVAVEGRIKTAYTLGTESATVMVEEHRKTR